MIKQKSFTLGWRNNKMASFAVYVRFYYSKTKKEIPKKYIAIKQKSDEIPG